MANQQQNGKVDDKVEFIPVSKIRENEVALRPVDRESEAYLELSDSVKKRGVMIPILVREFRNKDNPDEILYGLIDGLQRYNAACDNGLKTIAAKITTADQAEIEELQIVANVMKIETKPTQYAKQIDRLLQRNPTLTIAELSGKLSKSTGWIYKMLGMVKNLIEELHPAVDDGRLKLTNAHELSKLPKEEQPSWIDRAMTQDPGEFTAGVALRMKTIREARRKGRTEAPDVFAPVPHGRKWAEIKNEFLSKGNRDPFLMRNKVTSPAEAWDLAIAWCCHMDPDSQVAQHADHETREEKAKAATERRKAERQEQKEEEARKMKIEIEEKVRAEMAGAGK